MVSVLTPVDHLGPVSRVPEFTFELRVCDWVERTWPPERDGQPIVVARQLGTRRRRWDTVLLEVDHEALARRARFGERGIDSELLDVVRNAPAEWEWYRDALPEPEYPWRYVREAVHRAADRDLVETRRTGNRIELRRRWRYPDWIRRLIAIENKPDLDAAAARELAPQLERDVALGLADEVWLATAATGEPVEPALLEDLPPEAGILVFDFDAEGPTREDSNHDGRSTADVLWHPRTLAVEEPGTRILDRPAGGPDDLSAARFEYASPGWKADKRLEIAERAYGRGWRSYLDTMRPDCRSFELRRDGMTLLPYCTAKDRGQTSAECAGNCSEFEPEPPAWRSRGWPIEGGPGRGIRRLLERRRERRRPG